MSPPEVTENSMKKNFPPYGRVTEFYNFSNLEELITYEEKNVLHLLNTTLKSAPSMLGCDGVKTSKVSGKLINIFDGINFFLFHIIRFIYLLKYNNVVGLRIETMCYFCYNSLVPILYLQDYQKFVTWHWKRH